MTCLVLGMHVAMMAQDLSRPGIQGGFAYAPSIAPSLVAMVVCVVNLSF